MIDTRILNALRSFLIEGLHCIDEIENVMLDNAKRAAVPVREPPDPRALFTLQPLPITPKVQHNPPAAPLVTMDDDVLISQNEAAKLLGISPTTLKNARWRANGPAHIKIGKTIVYKRQTVRAWVKAQETGGRNKRWVKP